MATRIDIVTEAREWLNTRWQHQASMKGVACDCAGLVRGVVLHTGMMDDVSMSSPAFRDFEGYTKQPSGGRLEKACLRIATRIPVEEAQPGDVVLMQFGGMPTHVGLLGDYPGGGLSLIHAYAPLKKVVECRLDATWMSRITAAYTLNGTES